MTKILCALALFVAVANAAPLERTFHLNAESDEPVDAAPEETVDDSLRTHSLSHGVAGKKVELTIKKVFVKSHVPVIPAVAAAPAAPASTHGHEHAHDAHPHEHAHDAHAHEHAHDAQAHEHAHTAPAHAHEHTHVHATPAPTPAHAHAHAHAHGHGEATPLKPLGVVLDHSSIPLDKTKLTAIVKKLLSGVINNVQGHGEPLVVSPGGKPVALILSAAMHVVDLGNLQTLVSAQGAAMHPSFEPSFIKVDVAKLADSYAAQPTKVKTAVVTPAEYTSPASKAKPVLVESKPGYVAAATAAVSAPSPAAVYAAPAATVPPLAYPAAAAPIPSYQVPVEADVADIETDGYQPVLLPPVKKFKKIEVTKNVY